LEKYQQIESRENTLADCTIIVLSKNHESYLLDCLTSINRELSDVKILCADIGSIDESFKTNKKICMNLGLKSTHVQLGANTRTLTALKSLEKFVSTNYVILLSADDAFGIGYREALVKLLKTSTEYSVINFPLLLTDENLKPLHLRVPRWTGRVQENRRRLSYSNPGTAPGAVIPWKILINSDSWKQPPNIVIEDYWIWWQLISLVPFITAQESHVLYRQHQSNISNASKNKDYAYSLGYVSAIPSKNSNKLKNQLLSLTLIPRWIRHLHITVWVNFFSGYREAKRSETA
jgi:glycosyltransferase involved in cell wall biosynthesis